MSRRVTCNGHSAILMPAKLNACLKMIDTGYLAPLTLPLVPQAHSTHSCASSLQRDLTRERPSCRTPQRSGYMSGCQRLVSACLNLLHICHRSVTNLSQAVTDLSPHGHKFVTRCHRDVTTRRELSQAMRACDFARAMRTTAKRRFTEFHIFVACVAGVSHVSQDCHRDVARLSRSVTRCRRCVARCHRDVTAKSHICHTLSQAVATTVTLVTPCHRVSIHLSTCRQVDI